MAGEPARGPRKRFTKPQAVRVTVAGVVLLVGPWFIPSPEGTNLFGAKAVLSLIGVILLCAVAYFRK